MVNVQRGGALKPDPARAAGHPSRAAAAAAAAAGAGRGAVRPATATADALVAWAPAVGVLALAFMVGRIVVTVDSFAPYMRAFWSLTLAMSYNEKVGAVFPLKWEDMLYCTVIALVNCTVVLVAVLAIAATTATPPPEDGKKRTAAGARTRSPFMLGLHVAYLAAQAYMELAHKEQLHALFLCTWSWWSTGLFAVASLVTAGNVNAPERFPLTAATLISSIGLSVWTHVSYLRILPTYHVQNLLHFMPFAYYTLSISLDDRRRPPLSLRTATVVTHVAGVVPILILLWYGQIYDYRDIYSGFFEMYGVSSWWPSLETTLMSATTIIAGHLLYGYASPAVRSRRQRLRNLAIIVAAAAALPTAVVIVQPIRLHHMRNCPPPALNLAYVDRATGALTINATSAARLRAATLAPLYVHAVLSPAYRDRAIADSYLARMIVSPVLETICPPVAVPPTAGEIWVRAVPLPFTHWAFRSRVISFDYNESRVGTILIVYADGDDDTTSNGGDGSSTGARRAAFEKAAVALLAVSPSTVFHLHDAPPLGTGSAELATFAAYATAAAARRTVDCASTGHCVSAVVPPEQFAAAMTMDAVDHGLPEPAPAALPPLGLATLAVTSTAALRAAGPPYDGYNMTALLDGSGAWPALFARLAMTEMGVERTTTAMVDGFLEAQVHFARWSAYPFIVQQFTSYIPAVPGDDAVNLFLDTLERAL